MTPHVEIARLLESLGWAIGLVLVIEGLLPFVSPAKWRLYMREILKLGDRQIRAFALLAIALGLVLITALG